MEQNKIYTLEIMDEAYSDLVQIITTYSIYSKKGAQRLRDKFATAVQQIKQFPYSGGIAKNPNLTDLDFRMLIIEKYLLFYKVFENNDTIVIHRIFNGKTDYQSLLVEKIEYDS